MDTETGIWTPQRGTAYSWPRDSEEAEGNYITAGRLKDLPFTRSKTVRIFLSSTFTDTYTERNMLMQEIFPKLKSICKDKYELDFQVVDMRWGVRDEASDDHSASELCMRELHSCQQLSVGPTFVALLSHRYGSRPIPKTIPNEEMTEIVQSGLQDDDIALLKKWFKKDSNAIPPHWKLESLVDMALQDETFSKDNPESNYLEPTADNTMKGTDDQTDTQPLRVQYRRMCLAHGRKLWQDAEPKLATILRSWATAAQFDGRLDQQTARKYIQSVTEEEVVEGLLKDPDPNSHCLCFIRNLKDINLKHTRAWRFIDQLDAGQVDSGAQEELRLLKDEKVPSQLGKKNIFNFDVPWSDEDGGGVNAEEHSEYLKNFGETMEKEIIRLIEAGLRKTKKEVSDPLNEEILEHAHQAIQKCQRFHGREEILSKIEEYITSDSNEPLVIHGESGCGKTSLMAKAASEIPNILGDDANLHIVSRFLGTTPFSSNLSATLTSITHQIHRTCFGVNLLDEDIPQNFNDTRDLFIDLLYKIEKSHKLVLILDSLDQLSSVHEAHELKWLPTVLPPNVKLVVSTLPTEHNLLSTLRKTSISKKQYIEVEAMSPEGSMSILKLWLAQQNRQLTEEQMLIVSNRVSESVRPLYLKLIFDEIVAWQSDQDPSKLADDLKTSIPTSIIQLFDRLESKHGPTLVQRAFGYLSAAKNGLTELEMEDLLSLDDDVLNDVFEYHVPPIRRLPSILWARIRADISEYIVDREADGARVMAWYHRQFVELALRYFPKKPGGGFGTNQGRRYGRPTDPNGSYSHKQVTIESQRAMAKVMHEYFLDTWTGGKQKPFQYTNKQMKKLGLENSDAEANRYVSPQPSIFRNSDGTIDLTNVRHNQRKVSELPHTVKILNELRSSYEPLNATEANTICRDLFFTYEFLLAWSACSSWSDIESFIQKTSDAYQRADKDVEVQLQLLRQAFLLCCSIIYNNPLSLATQLGGRLAPYRGALPLVTHLLDDIEKSGMATSALLATHFNLEAPGGAVLYVVNNHQDPVNHCILSGNALYSVSRKLVVANMTQGAIQTDVRPRTLPPDDEFTYICKTIDKSGPKDSDWQSLAHDGQAIACLALKRRPWVYIMEAMNGQVRDLIHVDDLVDDPQFLISGMDVLGDNLVVFSTKSSKVVLLNAVKGDQIFTFDKEGAVVGVFFLVFKKQAKLLIIRRLEKSKLQLQFIQVGSATVDDDSSGQDVSVRLDSVDNNWHLEDGIIVDLDLPSPVVTCKLSEVKNFLVIACEDGTMTYFLMEGEYAGNPYEDSDLSSDEDEDKKKEVPDANDDGVISHSDLQCIQRTITTDYAPVHALSLLRESIQEKMLLAIACTKCTLVLYQMFDGSPVIRIRKYYENAACTGSGRFIIACTKGIIDLYILDTFNGKMMAAPYASVDAHSRPIKQLGVLNFDMMFYSSSDDGSLKFWNTDKMANQLLPRFDRVPYSGIRNISSGGPSPSQAIAITADQPTATKLDVWHVVTGKILTSLRHPARQTFCCHYMHEWKRGQFVLLALDIRGNLIYWEVNELVRGLESDGIIDIEPRRKEIFTDPMGPEDKAHDFLITARGPLKNIVLLHKTTNCLADITFGDKLSSLSVSVTKLELPEISLIYANENDIVLYCMNELSVHTIRGCNQLVDKTHDSITALSLSAETSILLEQFNKTFHVKDLETGKIIYHPQKHDIDLSTLSPDGRYVVWIQQRELRMVRVSDGRLLAKVTLYDIPDSLTVTPDGWFVVMGMPDGRLYVLVLSDPQEPSHQKRMAETNRVNPGIGEAARSVAEAALSNDDDDFKKKSLRLGFEFSVFIDLTEDDGEVRTASRMGSSLSRTDTSTNIKQNEIPQDNEFMTHSTKLCAIQ